MIYIQRQLQEQGGQEAANIREGCVVFLLVALRDDDVEAEPVTELSDDKVVHEVDGCEVDHRIVKQGIHVDLLLSQRARIFEDAPEIGQVNDDQRGQDDAASSQLYELYLEVCGN